MVHLAAQIDVSEYSDSRKFVQRALQSSFIVAENCEDDHHVMMIMVMMMIIMMMKIIIGMTIKLIKMIRATNSGTKHILITDINDEDNEF